MMKKTTIILISLLTALIIMSSGYGLWHKEIIIEGDIEVVPDPEVIKSLEAEIENKYQEIGELFEEQRIRDELKTLEAQRLLEEQKKLEEQRLIEEQKKLEENSEVGNIEDNNESEAEIIIVNQNNDNNFGDEEDINTTIHEEVEQVEDSNQVYEPNNE